MSALYYVLSREREELRESAVKQAIINAKGSVCFYESWPGEEPQITFTEDARLIWRPFYNMVCSVDNRLDAYLRDYQDRAERCKEPGITLSKFGVHDAVFPLGDEHGVKITLIGGQFIVDDRKEEAEERLERFLETIPGEERNAFRQAWDQIPVVNEEIVFNHILYGLEVAGQNYRFALKQRNDLRYLADIMTHDVVIALQATIVEIEILKIDLMSTYHIGREWEARFEELLNQIEETNTHLNMTLLPDASPQYTYRSITKMVWESVNAYLPQAGAENIEFRVRLEGTEKELATSINRTAFRLALSNVLDNAIKYSFPGTQEKPRWVDVVIQHETERGIPGFSILVTNYGLGISEAELDLVFEPGYRGKLLPQEHRSHGSGMGLALAKASVEELGGTMTVQSQSQLRRGRLTTFRIWVPKYASHRKSAEERSDHASYRLDRG